MGRGQTKLLMRKSGAALAGLLLLWCGAPAAAQTPEAAATIQAQALIEPAIQISVTPGAIHFASASEPGPIDADSSVNVTVASNCAEWTVTCIATDLLAGVNGETAVIPASRLSMNNEETGGAYVTLDTERTVAHGGAQPPTLVSTMLFQLQTTWEDRPGQYQGEIQFHYVATP